MRVVVNNSEFEANPTNAVIINCSNDMLNGFFVDYPDTYAFIPDDAEGYNELALAGIAEHIPYVDIHKVTPELLEQSPFKWIVNTLGRLTVKTAEDILHGSEA